MIINVFVIFFNIRFASTVSKLPAILLRGAWRGLDEAMLPMHKLRLESMITVC